MSTCYILKSVKDKTLYDREQWIEDYTKFLRNLYGSSCSEDGNPYKDPDAVDSHNEPFYSRLAEFLNKRECDMSDQLNGKWRYEFIDGEKDKYGIHVKNENDERILVLFSDQFGFSAHERDRYYPYDHYAELAGNDPDKLEKAISDIAVWIFESRSIGGSFLWPRHSDHNGWNYNQARGGTRKSINNPRYYIEDRVDLTLLEIKHIFDEKKTETDILYSFYNECKGLRTFFDHFGSFNTYIDFFKMGDFVENDNPIDIMAGRELTATDAAVYRKKLKSIYSLGFEDTQKMLSKVNEMIVARTGRMQ